METIKQRWDGEMGKWEEGLVEDNSSKIKPNGKEWVVSGSSYEWEDTHGSLCLSEQGEFLCELFFFFFNGNSSVVYSLYMEKYKEESLKQ